MPKKRKNIFKFSQKSGKPFSGLPLSYKIVLENNQTLWHYTNDIYIYILDSIEYGHLFVIGSAYIKSILFRQFHRHGQLHDTNQHIPQTMDALAALSNPDQ